MIAPLNVELPPTVSADDPVKVVAANVPVPETFIIELVARFNAALVVALPFTMSVVVVIPNVLLNIEFVAVRVSGLVTLTGVLKVSVVVPAPDMVLLAANVNALSKMPVVVPVPSNEILPDTL